MKPLRKHWAAVAVDRMDKFQNLLWPGLGKLVDEWFLVDPWQEKVATESVKPVTPTVKWSKGKVNPARLPDLSGALIGHTVSHHLSMCQPEIWEPFSRGWNDLVAKLSSFPALAGLKDLAFEESENPFAESLLEFEKALGSVMRLAVSQSLSDQAEFFAAYSKALKRGSVGMDGKGVAMGTRTASYQLIMAFGPIIRQHCESVGDVHRLLVALLGPSIAGDRKRTEETCKTIGLKFKGPGRLPKRKQSPE